MSLLLAGAAFVQAVVPQVDLPETVGDPCSAGPAFPVAFRGGKGGFLTVEDQVRLADIGRSNPGPAPNAFGLSPDGSQVAVRVRYADPDSNGYCQTLVVVGMDSPDQPVEIDRGGEFIRDDFPLRKFSVTMAGWDKPNTPKWSPDGTSVAYLRREKGSTQVWLADPTGRLPARQASFLPDDVDDFAWSPDGKALVLATRPGIARELAAIREEGLRGYLFDERFGPQFADHPLPTGEMAHAYWLVSLESHAVRPATSGEIAFLTAPRPASVPPGSRAYRAGTVGHAAWLEPKSPAYLLSPTRLVLENPDGTRSLCESEDCEGIRGLWWGAGGRSLFMLQKTGWAGSKMALLRWDPGDPAPRRIVLTDDVFTGCELAGEELVCTREGSLRPRRLVAIDMSSGKERVLLDPNPGFASLRLGTVQRFHFRNAYGVESFADLVLPPGHRPGERHPLVVVQYWSYGFLRGGTGDEVPIQPLAAAGFAVLSFNRPDFLPEAYRATTEEEMRTLSDDPWADRRQVLSSLEIAVEHALATGAVDPQNMGISGFSDGSATARFAILNTDLFKAASISSCCEDMYSYALAAGPTFTDYLRTMRYRFFEPGMEEFWKPASIILNADRIKVPILSQTSDTEYEGGLDVLEVLRQRGKPIELYVFPGEPHVKFQPAHRRAIYERNLEWFAFWLLRRINCDPARAEQYERWKAMAGAPPASELSCMAPPSAGP